MSNRGCINTMLSFEFVFVILFKNCIDFKGSMFEGIEACHERCDEVIYTDILLWVMFLYLYLTHLNNWQLLWLWLKSVNSIDYFSSWSVAEAETEALSLHARSRPLRSRQQDLVSDRVTDKTNQQWSDLDPIKKRPVGTLCEGRSHPRGREQPLQHLQTEDIHMFNLGKA